jgi:hypothetical protein
MRRWSAPPQRHPRPPTIKQRAQVAWGVLACVILGVGVWAFGPWRLAAPGPAVLTMMAVPSVAVLPLKVIGEASSQGDAVHTLV